MRWLVVALSLAAAPAAANGTAEAPCLDLSGCVRIAPAEMLTLADRYMVEGRAGDAETLLATLAHDQDLHLRTEARFRLAQLRERSGDLQGAAGTLRTLLTDNPDAARPRLELARLLARLGDESGARRELRTASATGLPDDVARAVDNFSAALRSTQPFGGSFELAIAPDSNINRATARDTINTVIAPLELDDDARQRSGLGVTVGGQAFWRQRLGETTTLLTRFSARGDLYGRERFNDIGATLAVGPELRIGSSRLRPAATASRRWFGGQHYSDGIGGTINWLRPLTTRSQIEADVSAIRFRYPGVSAQNGTLLDGSLAYDLALSSRASARVSARATRQGASVAGLALTSFGFDALVSHQVAGQVVFVTGGYSRLAADARLALFPERRQDQRFEFGGGLVLRGLSYNGAAPMIRVTRTINRSSVDLFDFTRTRFEFGLSRAF